MGGMWVTPEAGEVQEAVGTQPAGTHIGRIRVSWISGFICALYSKYVQGRMVTIGGVSGGNHGGNRRH